MNKFWNNILRYPRFFISSLIGLILIIITPIRNLFRIPKFRILVILFIFLTLSFTYLILIKMTGR